jgi:predicted DCC family thiol-disulfide oxidoreductase YuxK
MGNNSVACNSIILIEGDKHFIKSAAVLKILRELRGYSFLYHILKLFPRIFLDSLYNFTAKTRYKIFGQTKHCAIYQKSEFSNRVANAPENS